MKARSTWPVALLLASLGCSGGAGSNNASSGNGGGGSEPPCGSGPSSTPCALPDGGIRLPDGAVVTSPPSSGSTAVNGGDPVVSQQTWRLANAEYANTVHDLLGTSVASVPPLDPDAPAGGFKVGGPAQDAASRAYHDAAVYIASQAVMNMAGLMQSVGCAANAGAACFIPAFYQKAYRRSFDTATQAAITTELTNLNNTIAMAPGGSATLGIQAVIEAVLQSPYFLYHLEVEEQAKGPGKVAVTNFSMANRLSYLLWSSMPDAIAIGKAQMGQLSTPDQIKAEATRMIADGKAKIGLRNFYDQWLTLVALPSSKPGPFANVYTPAVVQALADSFNAQVDDALWAPTGALKTLLTSTQVYVNATLAPIFGINSASPTLQKVAADPTQRTGILTHPAIMATYGIETQSHPIRRGRFVWERLLCQPFPDPPATTPIGAPTFSPPMPGESLRQDFERLTAGVYYPMMPDQPHATYCMPCHSRLNPVGFLFENYDTTGKYRTMDDFMQPVKTSDLVVIGAADKALDVPTTSAIQLATNLATHDGEVSNCLIQELYQYAAKRDTADADSAALASLQNAFSQSQENLTQVLLGLTQADVFLYRLNVQ